jgi:gas vesicle protein
MSRTKLFFALAGIGLTAAAAGATAGLLLAPASGTETRRRMRRRLEDERASLTRACARAIDRATTVARQEIERRMSCAEKTDA